MSKVSKMQTVASRICLIIFVNTMLWLPGSAHGEVGLAASTPDKFDTAIAMLRSIQSSYSWCSFVAEIDDKLIDRDGKTYEHHTRLGGQLAGDAFAFDIVRDLLKASKPSEQVDVPLIKVTFDGRVQANLETPRLGGKPATLGYHSKDAGFADSYAFWPTFGFFEFSKGTSLADTLKAFRLREPGNNFATVSDDNSSMHLVGRFSTIGLMVDINLDGPPVISNVKFELPQDVIEYKCSTWATSGASRVPTEVVITRESTDHKEHAKIVVKFSSFDVRDPSSMSIKKLSWIPESPGTVVIDALKRHSYMRMANGGFEWLPFFDPVTGNTTVGPKVQE